MIYHVFANKSNIGDWLSAMAIQKMLRSHAVTELFCDRPFWDRTLTKLSRATPDDLVVIGGGGLFMDYFEPFWSAFEPIGERVPYCIWGVGFCDLKRDSTLAATDLLRRIVDGSRLTVVRDELTRGYLSPQDIPPAVACPVTTLLEPQPLDSHAVLLSQSNHVLGREIADYVAEQVSLWAAETGRPVLRTTNRFDNGNEIAMKACLANYRNVDVVVTGRLHGAIIGVSMGRRVIAVSGDRKLDAFMEQMGLGDWLLDLGQVERLPDLLSRISTQPYPAQAIETAKRGNAETARRVLEMLDELAARRQARLDPSDDESALSTSGRN